MRNSGSQNPVPGCWALLVGLSTGAWFAPAVSAGEFSYGLGYFGEYNDNIRLAPSHPQKEWTNIAAAGIAYQELGPTLAAHVNAEAQYFNYTRQTYADTPRYYADAAAVWAISPQRLHWVVVDRADQATLNPSLRATPDNLTNSNIFSTGPDVFLRLGPVNTIALGGRYGRASYTDGGTSNDRHSGSARWLYESNSETTYSLNYEYLRVLFDNDVLNENFSRHDLYLQADLHRANTQVNLQAGATHIYQERGGETSGPAFRVTATRRLNSEATASILAATEFLDPATDLLTSVTSPTTTLAVPTAPATRDVSGDFYHTKRVETSYTYAGSRLGVATALYYRDIDYNVVPMDRAEAGGRVDGTLNPAGQLSTTVFAAYGWTEFHNFFRNDSDTQVGVRFQYRMTPNLSAALEARRTWHVSTDPLQEYNNDTFLVSLVYVSNPLFSPVRR